MKDETSMSDHARAGVRRPHSEPAMEAGRRQSRIVCINGHVLIQFLSGAADAPNQRLNVMNQSP